MKKEYLPMALGFWGISVPLLVFGALYGRTAAERAVIFLTSGIFLLLGLAIFRAKR